MKTQKGIFIKHERRMALLAAVTVFCTLLFTAQLTWTMPNSPGSGTKVDPYQIANCSQLQNIDNDLSAYYVLMSDIDCSETASWNNEAGFDPIGGDWHGRGFRGTFDGKGHVVKNLFIERPTQIAVGLFGRIFKAEIKNVGLKDVNVTGYGRTGGLIGQADNSLVKNCHTSGRVAATDVAIGGLIGNSDNGLRIRTSYSSAEVISPAITVSNEVGGLIGYIWDGSVRNSYATGNVVGNEEVGGLVGSNWGPIKNSYSTGHVSGNYFTGGLVGQNYGSRVKRSYWDTQTSGQSVSDGGTGKTTEEMKRQSTFKGWNFGNIWTTCDNTRYPALQWEDLSCHEIVNELVTFAPDRSSYYFTSNPRGCPNNYLGKFGFDALLTNISRSSLSDVHVQIREISNGNKLLVPSSTHPERDQGRIFGTDGVISLKKDSWSQSITAGISGELQGIEIQITDFNRPIPPTLDFDVSVHSGANPTIGSALFAERVTITGIKSEFLYTWDLRGAGLLFEVGKVFTFSLRVRQSGVDIAADYERNGKGYAAGELFRNGSRLPIETSDMAFITYVNPRPFELIGAGDTFPVPAENGYSDGKLGPAEHVDVPFTICLKNKEPFAFSMDVLGVPQRMK